MYSPRSVLACTVPVVVGGTPAAVQTVAGHASATMVHAAMTDTNVRLSLSPRRALACPPLSSGAMADTSAVLARQSVNATAMYADASIRAGSPLSPRGVSSPTYTVAAHTMSPRPFSGSPTFSGVFQAEAAHRRATDHAVLQTSLSPRRFVY